MTNNCMRRLGLQVVSLRNNSWAPRSMLALVSGVGHWGGAGLGPKKTGQNPPAPAFPCYLAVDEQSWRPGKGREEFKKRHDLTVQHWGDHEVYGCGSGWWIRMAALGSRRCTEACGQMPKSQCYEFSWSRASLTKCKLQGLLLVSRGKQPRLINDLTFTKVYRKEMNI